MSVSRREFVRAAVILPLSALAACQVPTSADSQLTPTPTSDPYKTRLPYTNGFGSMPCSKCIAPKDLTWQITIPPKGEPGEPLLMTGTIFQQDGTTPAEGIVLYVYHTDATGYYNKDDDPYNPRLRGWMKTGKDGKYEFRTIKPSPYPHRTTPAHIHAQIFSDQIPEYGIDEYWFEGDPFITPSEKAKLMTGRGGFNPIIKLTRSSDGILTGVRNIKLD
jgi:protocatechuate 3,4-dioxygenase beta subunit